MFDSIFYNGEEYNQMWLNGSMIWEKDSGGGVVYPYDDADSVITYMNTSTSAKSASFTVIDSSLPYSINGTSTTSFSFPASSETQVKLVNLKPTTSTSTTFFPINIEQLRIPNLTDLSYLFRCFGYDSNYEYSWSPQYFEFSDNVTNMSYMFYNCQYLTDEMFEQFMPYFPNTSQVTTMNGMFNNCQSLTHLNLSSLNVNFGGLGTSGMSRTFSNCTSLKELHLETLDTSGVDTNTNYGVVVNMFGNLTSDIYVNKNTWTLDTHFCSYNATNANFILVDDNGSQEEVFKPQYHTEFTSTSNLPSWLSVYSEGDEYYFTYSSSGYYYNTNTKYHSTTAENVFQVDAPMTGTLKIYLSASSKDGDEWRCSNKLASESSYGTTTYLRYNGSNKDMCKRCHVYEMPVVAGESYHVQVQFRQGSSMYTNASYSDSGYIYGFSIDYIPITSIDLTHNIYNLSNVEQQTFTINPTIAPSNYTLLDYEVVYDSTYLLTSDNSTFKLFDGCQGKTLDITYRGKTNSISKTITFTVSEDAVLPNLYTIDWTQSTAPTLLYYMTVDKNNTYSFSHGTYTTDVYGLIPSNKGKKSTTAYTRYKYVAPKSGALTFTYRCYAETNYDYLTVHVNTSTSQPSTTTTTNQVFTTKGVSSYQNTDGTASVSVTEGTTYYIHVQYTKDSSGNSGYDMGCIRKIELK